MKGAVNTMEILTTMETCPHCSGELETGYFAKTGHALVWQEDDRVFCKGREIIFPMAFRPKNNIVKAKRCRKCRYLILPY